MNQKYFINFANSETYVSLTAWITVLEAALNSYMDASMRAITGGKYYPEGWS